MTYPSAQRRWWLFPPARGAGGEGGAVRGALLIALAVFLVAASHAAETPARPPVEITAFVEPKTVTIGTPFRYTMRIEADREVELVVPLLAGQLGEFHVIDFGEVPPREEQGRVILERWYTLVVYESGDELVPGPSVQYRVAGSELQSVAAPDALVVVRSLLEAEKEGAPQDVRDIKGPVAVPRDYTPLLWVGAGVLVLAVLGFGAFRWLNRPRGPAAVPARPAHEVALEALTRLRVARLPEAGRHEEYYVRLSAIVRAYLEARFGLRAPEMTTEEFLQSAPRDPQLTPAQRSLLGQFLSEADLVKFARYVPAQDDAERAYKAAREFVESTGAAPEVSRAAA